MGLQKSLPEILSTEERAHYRTMWGFDPVADKRTPTTFKDENYDHRFQRVQPLFAYEMDIPLVNDPELRSLGVTLHIRTEADDIGQSHNHMVLTQGRTSAELCCWHSPVMPVKGSEEIGSSSIYMLYPQLIPETITKIEGNPAYLPAWENFAALKSFASGLSEVGLLSLMTPAGYESGHPEGLLDSVQSALQTITPELVHPIILQRFNDRLTWAPALLASPDASTREKMISDLAGFGFILERNHLMQRYGMNHWANEEHRQVEIAVLEMFLAGTLFLKVGERARGEIVNTFLFFLEREEINLECHRTLTGLFLEATFLNDPRRVTRGAINRAIVDFEYRVASGEEDPHEINPYEDEGLDKGANDLLCNLDRRDPRCVLKVMKALFSFLVPASATKVKPLRLPPGQVGPGVVNINEQSILAAIGEGWVDIHAILSRLGIKDMGDARYIQTHLRILEKNNKIRTETKQGKKLYRINQ